MKKSKRTKASKRNNGVDLISNLPDPILQLILSGLPTTEEVVRTSILSTRWRYLWTSIPFLDIDCTRRLKPKIFKKKEFKEFVYWVLVNQTLDLESFRLCCANYYNMSTVGRWIQAAVMRKVKSLSMGFGIQYGSIELPHSLVKCESLEVLRLFLYKRFLSLPNVIGFPALRVLELNSVVLLGDDSVKQFFKSCPLLEDLSLVDCLLYSLNKLCISSPNLKTLRIDNHKMDYFQISDDDEDDDDVFDDDDYMFMHEHDGLCKVLQICCPKLVHLEYAGHAAREFSFENIGSLKKAAIYPKAVAKIKFLLGDVMCQLFAGVSHVESLSLNLSFIQCISAARDPNGYFPASLPNLKTLEISTTIEEHTMNAVIRILKCSPNLESLQLIIQEIFFRPELWKLDEVLTRHLKRVEFLEFNGEKRKLDMACFLLEQGNELEEMVFSWCDKVNYNGKSTKTMKKVLKCYKASSTVKLITLLKD